MKAGLRITICLALIGGILCGCQMDKKKEQVSLRLWGSEDEQQILKEISDEFCRYYEDQAEIRVLVGTENEARLKYDLLQNKEKGADVFSFADDQLYGLVSNEALLPIEYGKEQIIAENGGEKSAAVKSAMCEGILYACPKTASNGYFLFYNKEYLNEKDVTSFERILEVAEKAGKKVYMDWSSGWYIYSFFRGAGFELELNPDRLTNRCNWNKQSGKYKGTDVAEAMIRLGSRKSFLSGENGVFREGVENGEIIAGVSGTWNVDCVSRAYGDNYAAAKLPCYSLCGDQVQMASFCGFKMTGVNALTKEPEWAQKLAVWVTNERNQNRLFKATGEAPSNIKSADSEGVRKSPAIQALCEQKKFSTVQNVGANFWNAATRLGMILLSGNKDHLDLQDVLDNFVEETEAPAQ